MGRSLMSKDALLMVQDACAHMHVSRAGPLLCASGDDNKLAELAGRPWG